MGIRVCHVADDKLRQAVFRADKVVAGVGWSAIFFTAASTGNSYELLIIGNSTGNFYLFAGFLALLAAIIWPAK